MSNLNRTRVLSLIRCLSESFFFPFMALYLESKGYVTKELGVLMSLTPIVSMICAPLYSKLCKSPKITKNLLCVFSIIEAILVITLILVSKNFIVTILIVIGISIVSSTNYGMIDSLISLICTENNKTFSSVRVYGSASYMFGCVIAGTLVNVINYEFVFVIAATLFISTSIVYMLVKAPLSNNIDKNEKVKYKEIFTNKLFVSYLIFYILLMGTMQVGDDYYPLYLADNAIENYYSYIMFGFVLIEVIMLVVLAKYSKKNNVKLFFISIILLIFRNLLHSIPNIPIPVLVTSQLLRGFIWGIILYLNGLYIVEILGVKKATTGIILATFGVSIFSAIFKFTGGYIIDAIGFSKFYLILAAIAIFNFIYFIFYYNYQKKYRTFI